MIIIYMYLENISNLQMCPEVRLFHLVLNLFQATENLPASEHGRFAVLS